ncbi:hypothetical protein HMPREF0262_01115 [Clostridium sp. ATCC 29733]|nr:hypothetical protein HMPREF0262_01115 [Clostridium sp. ATCC 29733]
MAANKSNWKRYFLSPPQLPAAKTRWNKGSFPAAGAGWPEEQDKGAILPLS